MKRKMKEKKDGALVERVAKRERRKSVGLKKSEGVVVRFSRLV